MQILFGADGANLTHWKQFKKNPRNDLQQRRGTQVPRNFGLF
jgi:hypothetical protein